MVLNDERPEKRIDRVRDYEEILEALEGVGCGKKESRYNLDSEMYEREHSKGCRNHKLCDRAVNIRIIVERMRRTDAHICMWIDCCRHAEFNVNGYEFCREHDESFDAHGDALTRGNIINERDEMIRHGKAAAGRAEKALWMTHANTTRKEDREMVEQAIDGLKKWGRGK